MNLGRFTRRALMRAGLSAAVAAPFGRTAAASAAVAGAAQEQPVVGAVLAAAALATERPGASGRTAARAAVGIGAGLATRLVWPVAPKTPAVVAPHRTWTDLDPAPEGAGIGVVVNASAGNGRPGTEDPLVVLRSELPAAEVVALDDPSRLPDELERLAASGVAVLGVAGGDGSINAAAEVALRHNLPLLVVPAGTLNHLARDLGVETVADAVAAIHEGTAITIDVADIAGRAFLNTASFGSYAEIVDAREQIEHRLGKWPALVVALVRVLRRGRPIEVEIDGRRHRLWAVFVGNCRYKPEGMAPTWRERLDDGQLDVRAADATAPLSRFRLVLAVMTGRLHRSVAFKSWYTTNMAVRSLDGPLRLARDGETFDGGDSFDISKTGAHLTVFTPRPNPSDSSS